MQDHVSAPVVMALPRAVVLAALLVGAGVDAFPEIAATRDPEGDYRSPLASIRPGGTTVPGRPEATTPAQIPAPAPAPIPVPVPGLEAVTVDSDGDGDPVGVLSLSANDLDAISRCELPTDLYSALSNKSPAPGWTGGLSWTDDLIGVLWNV